MRIMLSDWSIESRSVCTSLNMFSALEPPWMRRREKEEEVEEDEGEMEDDENIPRHSHLCTYIYIPA